MRLLCIQKLLRYTRDLDLDRTTHLITETAKGAKYGLAASSNPATVQIVHPSWITSSLETGQRAPEKDHILESTIDNVDENYTDEASFKNCHLTSLLEDALDEFVGSTMNDFNRSGFDVSRFFLFEKLQFYLIGFEGNRELKQKISKLIRRANGTVHWNMIEKISIVIMFHECDCALREAAKHITTYHINSPPIVSPLWIIDSYKHSKLQPTMAYPPTRIEDSGSKHVHHRSKNAGRFTKNMATGSSVSSTASNFQIFRGHLFALVRSTPIIEGKESKFFGNSIVEFDIKKLEISIKAYGGQILSVNLLDALRIDRKRIAGGAKRKCHVLCWGESPLQINTNPLVSQLEQHYLCEVILVTPIWVQACISVRRLIRPERMPLLLVPQSWPMKSVLEVPEMNQYHVQNQGEMSNASKSPHRCNRQLEISLTGFQGTEKTVVVLLIHAIGGVYHDTMSNVNTHLIFKEKPTGLKLEKAKEWGLYIVSIQWLYHILKYGYGGIHKDELSCEERFSHDLCP